ncbi:PDZ domain-containing protein [Haloferula sp. BvORR071]|uniref:PDZ domain-containing protein n=1 Tax=Haloferula sp. BvORR071 TaxID=1396141 RepID=UPI00054FA08A|nr:PDZ domain-containing protein [Haloferula sp. BvORR071]
MESPEDIEKALAALVPSAISEKGQRSLDDLIDNLAAGNAPLLEMEMPASRRLPWGWIGGLGVGAAAVLAMAFQIPSGPQPGERGPVLGPLAVSPNPIAPMEEPGVLSLASTFVNQARVRDLKTDYEVVVTCRGEGHDTPEEEAKLPVVASSGPDTKGLGLAMGDLNEAVRAQVPELPRGFGFLVTSVEAEGPYGKAGVKPNDILWKIGDQWLANKAQFLTLLQLHQEGEEVKLGIYRSGKALDVPVVAGAFPDELRAYTLALGSARSKDGELDMPMKVIRKDHAEIERPDGKAILWQAGGVSEVRIVSDSGSLIYEGLVRDERGGFLVPDVWQARVEALERGLTHVVRENNSRLPRPRSLPVRQDIGDK